MQAKDVHDGPYPSGTAAAVELLFRLGALYEEAGWQKAALEGLEAHAQALVRNPLGHAGLLQAHLVGSQGSELAVVLPSSLAQEAARWFLPLTTLAFGPPGSLPVLRGRQPGLAYLCRWGACRMPVEDAQALKEELRALYSG